VRGDTNFTKTKNYLKFNFRVKNNINGIYMDDIEELGGNIELAGFKDVDSASMAVLKKIIGYSESCILDSLLTDTVSDGRIHVAGWFDNVFGFSNRTKEMTLEIVDHLRKQ